MRKIAAHTGLVAQGVQSRSAGMAGVGTESHGLLHPGQHRLHPPVSARQRTEQGHHRGAQCIGLAIAAGVDVRQHMGRQCRHRHFVYRVDGLHVVVDVHRGAVGHVQRAGGRAQSHSVRAQFALTRDGSRRGSLCRWPPPRRTRS